MASARPARVHWVVHLLSPGHHRLSDDGAAARQRVRDHNRAIRADAADGRRRRGVDRRKAGPATDRLRRGAAGHRAGAKLSGSAVRPPHRERADPARRRRRGSLPAARRAVGDRVWRLQAARGGAARRAQPHPRLARRPHARGAPPPAAGRRRARAGGRDEGSVGAGRADRALLVPRRAAARVPGPAQPAATRPRDTRRSQQPLLV
mmetsp:Transcript_2458/g.8746  ORF Transcript_2458/g.8746 Transcript_2458/m.8746 type:complete len:206 (-) Transcript_2458:267-884(-)